VNCLAHCTLQDLIIYTQNMRHVLQHVAEHIKKLVGAPLKGHLAPSQEITQAELPPCEGLLRSGAGCCACC